MSTSIKSQTKNIKASSNESEKKSTNQDSSTSPTSDNQIQSSCLPPNEILNCPKEPSSNKQNLNQKPQQKRKKVDKNSKNLQKLKRKEISMNDKKTRQFNETFKEEPTISQNDKTQTEIILQKYKMPEKNSVSEDSPPKVFQNLRKKKGHQKNEPKAQKGKLRPQQKKQEKDQRVVEDISEQPVIKKRKLVGKKKVQKGNDKESMQSQRSRSIQPMSKEKFSDLHGSLNQNQSQCSLMSTESQISGQQNSTNQQAYFNREFLPPLLMEIENQIISNLRYPQFPNSTLEFQLQPLKKQFKHRGPKNWFSDLYGFHEQESLPEAKQKFFSSSKIKVTYQKKGKLMGMIVNCDCNIDSQGRNKCQDRKIKKEYKGTDNSRRIDEIVRVIQKAMKKEVDFIVLQQVCNEEVRTQLLRVIESWNSNTQVTYYYPESFKKRKSQFTTMILSPHSGVKFGQLNFYIKDYTDQNEDVYYFPSQAYAEFQIEIDGEIESVCILSCHLRSNFPQKRIDENGNVIQRLHNPTQMRFLQFKCIQDFCQKYNRFFCIGDTNVPSNFMFKDQNQTLSRIMADAIYLNQTNTRGTFAFKNWRTGEITFQRLDRILMKIGTEDSTYVEVTHRDDIFLDYCQDVNYDEIEMLTENPDKMVYIRPTDHTILDFSIMFTSALRKSIF